MLDNDSNGGPRIQFRIKHVLYFMSAAFLALLGLLYNEVQTLEERVFYTISNVALTPPPPVSASTSLQGVRANVDPSEAPVNSNKACMDACRRAVRDRYGQVSESHEQWCRQICSAASLGRPEKFWLAFLEAGNGH